jgi:hypothetical protein
MDEQIEVALAWQRASNEADRGRLLALSAEDLAITGPRGTTRGREEVLAWLDRAGLRLRTLRLFARDGRVVVEQSGCWTDPTTGEPGDERRLATLFEVAAGRVVALARYDDLDSALVAGGLRLADEVPLSTAGNSTD